MSPELRVKGKTQRPAIASERSYALSNVQENSFLDLRTVPT